jgi:hypothetical protein
MIDLMGCIKECRKNEMDALAEQMGEGSYMHVKALSPCEEFFRRMLAS